MKDDLLLPKIRKDAVKIGDIGFNDPDIVLLMGEVAGAACGEIVNDRDRMAFFHQPINQMAPDKTRPTRH